MPGNLTFDALKVLVEEKKVDTVIAAIVDMQGRLMGKRFTASHFVDSAHEETHCCKYLLATDLLMSTPDGYANTSWHKGYGDYLMKPDLSTLRLLPWLEGTALVLCDVLDSDTHESVPVSPREVLKAQVARLADLGYEAKMATELEFFVFEGNYKELRNSGYARLEPVSGVNEDYHILQTTTEEFVMRPIRNHLVDAGIPVSCCYRRCLHHLCSQVENTKGEAETGQAELNIRYAPAMDCAEHHVIAKHAVKEICWQHGVSASFLAKWSHEKVGSSSHIHMSLWIDGRNAFYDSSDVLGMSRLMKHFLAGLIAFCADYALFLAPYINSYKRFMKSTFAPTKAVWSVDNRTAAFRLCGARTEAVRVECRIPGSDINPYLSLAAVIAAGIEGIKREIPLAPPATGDAYIIDCVNSIPSTLRDATVIFKASTMLRRAMGDDVIDHYTRCAEWEQEEFERVVTSWEIHRGFELA